LPVVFYISIIYFAPAGSSGSVLISFIEVLNAYSLFTNGVGRSIDNGITIRGCEGVEIPFCAGVNVQIGTG
jgi:hypothetical protein